MAGVEAIALRTLGSRIHDTTRRRIHYVACFIDDTQIARPVDSAVAATPWVYEHQLGYFAPKKLYSPVRAYFGDLCRADAS
uniref:Uncharacterized protein n=1 Tax=Streptomyces sp. ML694-90F3 TaxID=1265536 RepID=A0A077KT49_9ACTN|nr:hypothetical protein [Streptomyces sp. ML694-90F3]